MPRTAKVRAIVEEKPKARRSRATILRAKKDTLEKLMKGKESNNQETTGNSKSPKNSRTKVTRTPRKKTSPVKTEEFESISIPNTPSLRLMEKVELYHLWYNDRLPKIAETVAKGGGYLFIVLGLAFSFSGYFATKDLRVQEAVVICHGGECFEKSDEAVLPSEPIATFLNTIPTVLENDIDFTLRIEQADSSLVYLKRHEDGLQVPLNIHSRVSGTENKYLVPVTSTKPGRYSVIVELKKGELVYQYNGPSFRIKSKELIATESRPLAVSIIEEEINKEASSTTEEYESEAVQEITTGSTSAKIKESESELVITNSDELGEAKLSIEQIADAVYVKIDTGDHRPLTVLVKSSLSHSSPTYTLGDAYNFQGEWIFSLSALSLPSLPQVIFASYEYDGQVYETPGINYLPKVTEKTTLVTPIDASIFVEKVKALLHDKQGDDIDRRVNIFSSNLNSSSTSSTSDPFMSVTSGYESIIDSSLLYYAATLKSQNPFFHTLAKERIQTQIKRLALEASLNDPLLLPYYQAQYANLFSRETKRAEELAVLYDEATAGLIVKDTDSDGLSDFDEISIFGTSVELSDSDSDGVIDIIEVVSGTNPLVAAISETPSTESYPIAEFENEAVKISSLKRVVSNDESSAKSEIVYVIQGKTIPNTYLNIVDYESKTLGLIRSGQTGEFSYSLPPSVEKNRIAVGALLTDSFGKVEAGSLLYVAEGLSADKFDNENLYANVNLSKTQEKNINLLANLVIALCVVLLGFLLILLAKSLRIKDESKKLKTR